MADTKQATPNDNQPCENTDRDLWRESPGDYYADRIFVNAAGGIGIDVGGHCIVMPIAKWHSLALASHSAPDRTTDTVEYWKSRAMTAELKVLTFHEEIVKLRSGPDRTTLEPAPGTLGAKRHSAPHIGPCGICGSNRICEHDLAFSRHSRQNRTMQAPSDESLNEEAWHLQRQFESLGTVSHETSLPIIVASLRRMWERGFNSTEAGPDRATPEYAAMPIIPDEVFGAVRWIQETAELASGAHIAPKGPDRGQQDAPDELAKYIALQLPDSLNLRTSERGPVAEAIKRILQNWAKAAREGQAKELAELKAELQCMELRAKSAEKIAGL